MLLTDIGELVTNDPAPDREGGPLGIVRDAAVLIERRAVDRLGRHRPDGSAARTTRAIARGARSSTPAAAR